MAGTMTFLILSDQILLVLKEGTYELTPVEIKNS